MRAEPDVNPTAIIALLGFCGALVSITSTVTIPLLPVLPGELDTSVSNVSWVATAAFVTGAVANPVVGRLGDMYGKRRMMIGTLLAVVVGGVVAAAAPNVLLLIVGRAVQGFGLAVLPLGMSLAKDILPPRQTANGVALVSATLGVGSGLGLPLAGVLLGWSGWRSVFWVGAGLAVVAVVLAATMLPDHAAPETEPFDVVGAVWLSVVIVAVLLPLSKASDWGWVAPLPLALYGLGAVGAFGWQRYERRPRRPLVDVALMAERPLMLINTAGLLLGFAMFSNAYASIALLQTTDAVDHGFGLSVTVAGLVMLPGALAMMLTSPVSAWIIERYDARAALFAGALIIAVGYATRFAMLDSVGALAVSVGVVNAGIGIAYGAIPSATMAHVPLTETASANAIGTLTRSAGASVSSAAVASIFSSMTVTVGGTAIASLGGFQIAFGLSAAAAVVAAIVAYRLPRSGGAGHLAEVRGTTSEPTVLP